MPNTVGSPYYFERTETREPHLLIDRNALAILRGALCVVGLVKNCACTKVVCQQPQVGGDPQAGPIGSGYLYAVDMGKLMRLRWESVVVMACRRSNRRRNGAVSSQVGNGLELAWRVSECRGHRMK